MYNFFVDLFYRNKSSSKKIAENDQLFCRLEGVSNIIHVLNSMLILIFCIAIDSLGFRYFEFGS